VFCVVSSIDPSSVTEQDGFTRFTAVGEDGIGITVGEEGLILKWGAKLFSLDYVGKLMALTTQTDALGYRLQYGSAFANQCHSTVKKYPQKPDIFQMRPNKTKKPRRLLGFIA